MINIASWFDFTRYNKYADENINVYAWGLRRELSALALQASVVRLAWINHNEGIRREIREQFDAFSQRRSELGPLFVFAHIISLHPPYVFDEWGNEPDATDEKTLYWGRRQFMDSEFRSSVDRILSSYQTDERPIIMVLSDDGGKMHADPKYSYRVFSAMYLPGAPDSAWTNDLKLEDSFEVACWQLGFPTSLRSTSSA